MMMLRSGLFLLAAVIAMLCVEEARACDCQFGGSLPCAEYSRCDAIFQGAVVWQRTREPVAR